MYEHNLESELEQVPNTRFGKVKEWLCRYGPAELVGTIAAYTGFFLAKDAMNSLVVAAYVGTLGENVGFYGTMIVREVIADLRSARSEGNHYGIREIGKTAAKLITEFGPAEALDSLVVRPATMSLGVKYFGKEIGVGVGKIAADVIFYVPTIFSYELRKHSSDKNNSTDV